MSKKVNISGDNSVVEISSPVGVDGKATGPTHIQDGDSTRQNPSHKSHLRTSPSSDTVSSNDVDISCGIGSLRSNIFGRRFANLYVFAICFGLSNFFTSMVDQVITVQLTSLERQFNIDNVRAGLFQTASRAGFISTVLFAGHFAKKANIPLVIGVCGFMQGLVLTIPAIMQLTDPYLLQVLPPAKEKNSTNSSNFGDNAKYLCNTPINGTNETDATNSTTGEVKQLQFMVVLAVQAFKGISDTFHNGFLPTLYMDDNLTDKTKMGVFLGIWQIISELSGPIGKQINGILTKVPIDLIDTQMDPGDPRFVAAWWLAFLVFGLGTAVFSLPVMVFPRRLISTRQRQEAQDKAVVTFAGGEAADEVVDPAEDDAYDVENNDKKPVGKTLDIQETNPTELSESKRRRYSTHNPHVRADSKRGSMKRRTSSDSRYSSGSRRPSFFPPVVGPTERKVSIAGDLVFEQPVTTKKDSLTDMLKDFPKALYRVLRKPVFVLLLVDVALVSIPLSGTSVFRNTYMANEYNVPMSDVTLVSGITLALGHIIGTIISSWLCSRVTTRMGYMYIITSTYVLTLIIIPFYFFIGCDNEPVYGADGDIGRPIIRNISQCHCDHIGHLISCGTDSRMYLSPCYAGCSNVDGKMFTDCTVLNSTLEAKLTPGLCPTDCRGHFILYACLHGLHSMFSAMSMIPRRLLIIRVVDPQDRGFATSLFMFCFVFMAIPSPNLFGKVIDDTCLIWDGRVCSLYDRDRIRYLMSGIDIGVHGTVQATFLIMMSIFKWEEWRERQKAQREAASKDAEVSKDTGQI